MDAKFREAVETVARYYIAGIDSAVRHSRKGDALKYRESVSRSPSWERGYSFALNAIAGHGIGNLHGYAKEKLGCSCHSAECALLSMFDGSATVTPAPPKRVPERPWEKKAVAVEKKKDEPECETSTCWWYDHEVEGSRLAHNGKHAGMWYVRKVA